MTDPRTFHRHSEKTQAAIQKANDTLAPLCRPDSPDPAQVSVDDLRQVCLTLERADELLAQADELLRKQPMPGCPLAIDAPAARAVNVGRFEA